MSRTSFSLFSLLLALIGARAQQNPVIRTETRVVLIETIVTDKKGEYVHDLTAKDFRVWQDGKEQAITSLSFEADRPGAGSGEPHFLVLFFDDTRMTALDQARVRLAASRFIDANAGPRRLMAVVSYSGSLRVAQNFTDNAGRLKDALNRAEGSSGFGGASPERPAASATPASADNFRARNMLESVGNVAKGLGALPGRKTLVLLTGGLGPSSARESELRGVVEAASRAGVVIYPVDVRPVPVQADPISAGPAPRQPNFRRGGAPQGPDDATPAAAVQDTGQFLAALANGTGGLFVRESGDLLAGLQRIGGEQTEYYVIGYTPPESKEGICHSLRVKINRGGATVRARSAYCATKPVDLIAGTAVAKNLERRAASAETGNLQASIQLPYFYISPGVARVHLAMEIPAGVLKFDKQKGNSRAELNLLGIATAADRDVVARFSDTLKLDFESPETTVHYEKEFKIAPGQYRFTLTFESGAAGFGKIEGPLSVDPWNAGDLALSGVAISRETHPAADVGLVSSLLGDRTPLIAGGVQFVPFGSNRFARSEPGFFYVEVYDPDPAELTLRARVLDHETGELKWDSGVMHPPSPPTKPRIPVGTRLPLSSLAAGTYRLEITASDSGKQVNRTAEFEVK
ncbi:MAG TPA: VWA domain-containing protein [Bryobacteraceae bacterium]